MNNNRKDCKQLILDMIPLVKDAECDVVVCVPFTDIYVVKNLIKGTNIKLGAQNVHFAEKGAYTGEISADMLKELRVSHVIIGHSERRQYFGETDETVNKKITTCLHNKLKPIVCVGETLQERQENMTNSVLEKQILLGLKGFKSKDFDKIVIAYEPIWAIGTGKTATSEQAEEMCKFIRNKVRNLYDEKTADKMRIQYGGSVKLSNIDELMNMPNIDGALIGGASLNPEDFIKLVEAALK